MRLAAALVQIEAYAGTAQAEVLRLIVWGRIGWRCSQGQVRGAPFDLVLLQVGPWPPPSRVNVLHQPLRGIAAQRAVGHIAQGQCAGNLGQCGQVKSVGA
ncbi:hypothetical protein SDC9_187826 [bioreactor metagenome]|uniref:Uncharacterized protein n=1 Tax=bioreactor metagenome TaxID=1076179 RepID=A0A645HN85_9ZZZZ